MTDSGVTTITLDLRTISFGPIDLEFLTAARALERALHFLRLQRRAGAAVGTHAVSSAKVRRRFAMRRFGCRHDAPALGRPLPNLEPRAQHTDLAAIDFDNCLEIIEFYDAVPRATAELQRDVSLKAGEQKRH